jgi:hypothetical protein
MAPSALELVSATQQVADAFGTLCALISPDGTTVEFISYETATLTAAYRYNLTYLRRGVYGSPVSAFPAGSSFVYIGSYPLFKYTFQTQYIGRTVFLKFPAFNLTQGYIQPLANCRAYGLIVGLTGALVEETYVPSSNTVAGDSTITNPTYAYDKNFATAAQIATTAALLANSGSVTYAGFGTGLTAQAMTLYVNYSAASTTVGVANPSVGIRASLSESFGMPVWVTLFSVVGGPVPASQASGTLALSVPAGQDLSKIQVQVGVSKVEGSGAAAISINEIWMQSSPQQVSILVPVAQGGTGTASPSLIAGTNVTITGSFPNQTINATGGGGPTFVDNETVAGAGTAWTLAEVPEAGCVPILVVPPFAGYGMLELVLGSTGPYGYTISGANITTVTSFPAGSMRAWYRT